MGKRSHKNRRLDDHVSNNFQLVEENAHNAPVKDVAWQGQTLDTESDISFSEDTGSGEAIVVRCFTFGANAEAFKIHKPTKQELFNTHYKQIEIFLWKDGLMVVPEIMPRIHIAKNKKFYSIFVGAKPQRGHVLYEKPQTLNQLVHGSK